MVIEVTQFGIHEAVDIEEGFLAMSNIVSSVAIIKTRIFAVVEHAASVLGSEQRGPQRRMVYVEVSGSQGKEKIPGVESGGS